MRAWITGLTAAAALVLGTGAAVAQPAPSDVEAAFAAARDVSPVPLSLDREQAEWREYGDQTPEGTAFRIDELTERAARDRAAWSLRSTPAALASGCVPILLNDCHTVSGGYVARRDGPTLYWQLQRGVTETRGVGGGFVLLELEADGTTLRPVAWDYAGYIYGRPEWTGDEGGVAHVAIPGVHGGTGAHNADVIFRLTDNADRPLRQIDNFTWREGLDARLPQGLEVWKGVNFAYEALMANASLWRASDANCCPTGGEAFLDFEIRDDRLVLTGVQVNDALVTQTERVPADVFAWVQRRMTCDHWGGEEGYDAERAAQIAAALAEARCDALEADGQTLRRTHADDDAVLAMLARAGAM